MIIKDYDEFNIYSSIEEVENYVGKLISEGFEKKEEIYRVIFEKGNLASSNKKGEFFMRIFLTCGIIFLLFFRDKGGHGPTIFAFFEALMEAVKNKKISKSLVRSLVRRLRKNGIPVPPELEDLVAN